MFKLSSTNFWSTLALAAALSGCGEPLEYGQDLEGPRVLGVRVESDDGTSWPGAGRTADVQLLVAGPDGPVETRVAYQVCLALETSWGVPLCGDDVLADGSTDLDITPEFVFEGARHSRQEPRLAVLGVACVTGAPVLQDDPESWSCDDDSLALRFSFEATEESLVNENPMLDETDIRIADQTALLQSVTAEPDCDDFPELSPDETVIISISLDERARSSETDELLQISHFATKGRLERQLTILDPDESLEFELEFETPSEPGPIKFYLVVRDDRGGTSWVAFGACVVD